MCVNVDIIIAIILTNNSNDVIDVNCCSSYSSPY